MSAHRGDRGRQMRYLTATPRPSWLPRLKPRECLQLVLHLDRPREESGIKIVQLAKWLEALPFK
jgi:hypothetical protein